MLAETDTHVWSDPWSLGPLIAIKGRFNSTFYNSDGLSLLSHLGWQMVA